MHSLHSQYVTIKSEELTGMCTSATPKQSLNFTSLCGSRTGATFKDDSAIQTAVPKLPAAYVPEVAGVQAICTRLRNVDAPCRVVQIVGEPGQGQQHNTLACIADLEYSNLPAFVGIVHSNVCCFCREINNGHRSY